MAKPVSFNKRDNEKNKLAKRAEKQQRKEKRKSDGKKDFDDMIAYVDENGNITSTPPDMQKKEKVNLEDIIISTPKKTETEENSINRGRVEHFNASKGYGFIKSLSSIDKYFFHISNCPENIQEGNIVIFDLERGPKGMNAVNIKFEEQV